LALLIVVGVLGILAVLAAAFVTMAQLERRASMQRLHVSKAGLLARSGIEDALARLAAGQDMDVTANQYGGEDWDGISPPTAFESQQEAYQTGTENTGDCPVRHAMRPSFAARPGPGLDPRLVGVDGRRRGYSGRLSGDLEAEGNTYALKVEDESAKINVNGGLLDDGDRDADGIPDHRDIALEAGWNSTLHRLLLAMSVALNEPKLKFLISKRPLGGYRSLEEVQEAAGTTVDLSPYLTLWSWVDPKVVRPVGYNNELPQGDPFHNFSMSELIRGRNAFTLEEGGRPPVNLNAATRPLLLALVAGLKGKQALDPPPSLLFEVEGPMRDKVVDALVLARKQKPFRTWEGFSGFCDGLVDAGILSGFQSGYDGSDLNQKYVGGGNLCLADLLKANFDPNTRLNKTLPDQLMFRWIDKSDLITWSTEGSLGPTGTFTVGAVGRVRSKGGHLLAEATEKVLVEAFRLLRQTTQQDFVAGRKPDQSPTSYATLASGAPVTRTTGASASWNTWGAGTGLAVQTYPNPMPALPDNACELDGSVALASCEIPPDLPPFPGTELLFLHHFEDGWTADTPGVPPERVDLVSGPHNGVGFQKDPAQSIWPDPSVEPSTLMPDGVRIERGHCPGYQAQGNLVTGAGLKINRAAITFWAKPVMCPAKVANRRTGGGRYLFSCVVPPGSGEDWQSLLVAHAAGGWGANVDNCALASDANHERQVTLSRVEDGGLVGLLPGLRWQLATFWFDTACSDVSLDLGLDVRAFLPPTLPNPVYGPSFDPAAGEDQARPGAVLVIGSPAYTPSLLYNGYVQAVVDEVGIYDLGVLPGMTQARAVALARQRFEDGRYYKGDDGKFLSALLEPAPGGKVTLLGARWTEYLPREIRQEVSQVVGSWPSVEATGHPRPIDLRVLNARIDLALLDEAGTTVIQPLFQGAPIGRPLDKFRYRARFHVKVPQPDQPALETPVLDDITFSYLEGSGPRIWDWSQE
jgi:hypothetical protein